MTTQSYVLGKCFSCRYEGEYNQQCPAESREWRERRTLNMTGRVNLAKGARGQRRGEEGKREQKGCMADSSGLYWNEKLEEGKPRS